MNTLPEYKKYIPGCQCNFCKIQKKLNLPIFALINEIEFNDIFLNINDESNYWTQFYDLYGMKIFDPLNITVFDYPSNFQN